MVLRIGHRGAAGHEPENTLRSIKRALKFNVDAVEFDVRVCKTGEVVLFHNDRISTDGKGLISEMTFEELRILDFGKGEKIATLEQALNLINKKAKVLIDLKGKDIAKPVNKIIRDYIKKKGWRYEDFIVSSFYYSQLGELRKLNKNIKISVTSFFPISYLYFAKKIKANAVSLIHLFASDWVVKRIHRSDLEVYVWTVNSEKEIDRVKRLGVDGIISNYPERI